MNKTIIALLFTAFFALPFNTIATSSDPFDVTAEGRFDSAFIMWEDMAMDGNAQAQFNLALMYHAGLGVSLNEDIAVSWYHASAENGYMPAQEYLAVGYKEGWFGLPTDNRRAKFWQQQLGY